ncbi:MAG: hypothetical protein GX219_01035 [Tissierellia bacterium]|nr:hypothetical protein [Tissierellia bacterium]
MKNNILSQVGISLKTILTSLVLLFCLKSNTRLGKEYCLYKTVDGRIVKLFSNRSKALTNKLDENKIYLEKDDICYGKVFERDIYKQ